MYWYGCGLVETYWRGCGLTGLDALVRVWTRLERVWTGADVSERVWTGEGAFSPDGLVGKTPLIYL